MKRKALKLIIAGTLTLLCACVSPTRLIFSCDDPTVDIYIDGEYAGKALVSYVSCYEDGKEVYHRTFSKEGRVNNELIDLQIERNLQYSSGGRKAKTN